MLSILGLKSKYNYINFILNTDTRMCVVLSKKIYENEPEFIFNNSLLSAALGKKLRYF